MNTVSKKSTVGASSTRRWTALTVAVALTLTGGALYGSYLQRWDAPAELTASAAELAKFPREIGRWTAVEDLTIDTFAMEMLDCAGYVHRRYLHRDSGQSIRLVIIVGPPGPTAVHTPEICFSSRAYEVTNQRTKSSVESPDGQQHSFWKVDFTTRNAFADGLRVYYSWSHGAQWRASDSPRFELAGGPLLYKIQLATYVSPYLGDDAPDPGRQFLEEFLQSAWMPGASGQHYQSFD
jgi:hypothetical protein